MKLTEHCFAITGLSCYPPWVVNSGFITGKDKTLIVDSGFNSLSAATIYGYASGVKPDNRLILINTEQHLDHIGGNYFFSEKNVEIYGHFNINRKEEDLLAEIEFFNNLATEGLRKNLNEGIISFSNTHIKNPDKRIESDMLFDLGGLNVNIILTPGHTQSNLSVYVPSDEVLYCGDCMVNKYYPNLLAGNKEDWQQWLKSLEKISSLKPIYVVPGHGDVLCGSEIDGEIGRIREILTNAINPK